MKDSVSNTVADIWQMFPDLDTGVDSILDEKMKNSILWTIISAGGTRVSQTVDDVNTWVSTYSRVI